jgi:NADPH-dependent 2,4-dienoyl-CoA reductase/sulfur reductase-like enzyme
MLETTLTRINPNRIIEVSSYGNFEQIQFKSLIFATGCLERSAGAIKLPGDRPQGVMSAGQAQNYLNNFGYLPGKNVFILGSGDIGLIMARRMTLEGAKVLGVAELMPYSNGLKRNIVQCLEDYDIPLYLSTTVTKVIGKNRLTAIELSNVDENLNPIDGTQRIVECDTLLLSVGLVPYTIFLNPLNLKKDAFGKFLINEKCETSMEGLFVCGNSLHVHDLVDNVTKEARIAGFFASEYIKNNSKNNEMKQVKIDKNISYIIPNVVNTNAKDLTLKFRVRKPMENVSIVIKTEDFIIKKIKKFVLIPSEMESINIKLNEELISDIFVEVIDNE